MAEIFLSYAREDTSVAKELADALLARGWTVWWDRRIPPGTSFASMIERELNAAKCVIVLWSKASVNSDWCKNEADAACQRRVLVPALLEAGVEIPLAFRHLQAADITDFHTRSPHPGLEELIQAIAALLDQEGPPKPVRVKRRLWSGLTPTLRKWVALVSIVAMAFWIVLYVNIHKHRMVTIQGLVTDSQGHPLVDANVTIDATQFQATSNQDGYFLGPLWDPDSVLTLRVQHQNYKTGTFYLRVDSVNRDTLHIRMVPL